MSAGVRFSIKVHEKIYKRRLSLGLSGRHVHG